MKVPTVAHPPINDSANLVQYVVWAFREISQEEADIAVRLYRSANGVKPNTKIDIITVLGAGEE